MSDSPIGRDLPRRDSADKLRGAPLFTTDHGDPAVLHAALRRADVAAGRVVAIDTGPAERMPGVRAVATARDAAGLDGILVADQPCFAADQVRYRGEPLAAVAAETLEQARAAAAAIAVEVEPWQPLLTIDAALAGGAREIHPGWRDYEVLAIDGARGGNVAWEASVLRGDVEAAFARDDVTIVESAFTVPRQNQASLEPRACIARPEHGRVVLETSTQNPWAVKNSTAAVLGWRPSELRVVVPSVGGGFGAKFEIGIEPYAALLARLAGRPVMLVNTRAEEMQTTLCRENAEIRIRSAVAGDGAIAGREAVVLMDCGAYGGEQPFLTTFTAHTLLGVYRLGAVAGITQAVYTNTPPTGAFRACNGTYNTFALERHTDEICAATGIDRIEFRRANLLADGALGSTGQPHRGNALPAMLAAVEESAKRPPARPAATTGAADGRLRGTGVAAGGWFTYVGPSAATVHLNADGTASVVSAGVEIGSGSMVQAVPQMVAAELGIAPDDVVVLDADTDAAGFDLGVGGGRTSVSIGAAAIAGAREARGKLLDAAADALEAAPEDLELSGGEVLVRGTGVGMRISDAVAHAQERSGPIAGSGAFTAGEEPYQTGCAAGHYYGSLSLPIFAVHRCEVAVDPGTGRVEVERYAVAQDVGRAINPAAIRAQIQGGVTQGLGYGLLERITIGDDGAVDQRGLESYRLPLAGDTLEVESILHEGDPSSAPLGVKGAGEIPILCVAAAVANAVSDAIGRPLSDLPIDPPRVLAALSGRDGGGRGEGAAAERWSWRAATLADPEELRRAAAAHR